MRIICRREIVEDPWMALADDQPAPSTGKVLVSRERWQRDREALIAAARAADGKLELGVRIPGAEPAAVDAIAADLPHLALVAVEFKVFRDGRGFTAGRRLRERLGFRGEIRAVGWFLADQVQYLSRCGFDAFEFHPERDLETARRLLDTFSVALQPALDGTVPHWRRPAATTPSPTSGARAR